MVERAGHADAAQRTIELSGSLISLADQKDEFKCKITLKLNVKTPGPGAKVASEVGDFTVSITALSVTSVRGTTSKRSQPALCSQRQSRTGSAGRE